MRLNVGRLSRLTLGVCLGVAFGAAQAQTAPQPGKSPPAATSMSGEARNGAEVRAAPPPSADDSMTRNAAARTRMLECGHQWSAKKKAGTAVGTWKDFFKVCIARP